MQMEYVHAPALLYRLSASSSPGWGFKLGASELDEAETVANAAAAAERAAHAAASSALSSLLADVVADECETLSSGARAYLACLDGGADLGDRARRDAPFANVRAQQRV